MRLNETTFLTSTSSSAVVPCLERAAQLFSPERTLELERWIEYTRDLADWCIRQAHVSIATGAFEEAMRWNTVAARMLALRSDPLVSREIEESLLQIGDTLPRYPWQRGEEGAPKRFLHIIDQPRPYGGHTAMARRWIENDPGNHIHSVAILSTFAPVPEALASAVARSRGRLHVADQVADPAAPMLQRAAWLRKLAYTQADCVVLHTDCWNAVVPVAFGVDGGPPVLLVNHAAHIFWLGASVVDVVLNCRGSAYETHWTVIHRGIPRCDTLPIPLPVPRRASTLDPNVKRKAKIAIGLDPECIAVLTVGDSLKYRPIPGLSFLETSRSILERCPTAAMIVVGPTENADWRALAHDLNNRVKVIGRQLDLRMYHDAADLYIEGFPFGSTTAFLEAASEGIAGVLTPADCPPPFGTDGIAIDGLLPRPDSLEAYVSEVVGLIRNPAEREWRAAVVAQSVARHHVGSGWQQHLAHIVANTPAEHRVYPLGIPEPPPKELSHYWVSFRSTYFITRQNGDPLEYAFAYALQFDLKPRLDHIFRQACLRAKPIRNQSGAPLGLYYVISSLSQWFPKNWTGYVFTKFLVVLRANGRLRRELKSLRKRLSPHSPLAGRRSEGLPLVPHVVSSRTDRVKLMPRVSVVIPVYNGAEYIAKALGSILNQTYKDFEIIIVDDGSTDNTREIVNSLLDKHSHDFRYFYQENGGQSSARNRGIRESRGEYVSFLDQDDLWMPEFLQIMVRKIKEGFDWVVSDNFRDGIDVRTEVISRTIQRRGPYDGWDTNALLREFLVDDRVGPPGKILVKREVLLAKSIFFDSRADNREDWDFALQLVGKGCVPGWVHEPLFVYRVRSDGSNASRKRRVKTLCSTYFILQKNTEPFIRNDMGSTLGQHYFGLARMFWKETRNIKKFLLCMAGNVRYKGLADVVSLLRRKTAL